MPGYRETSPRGPYAFQQQTSGGQIPGELREWDRPVRREAHDHEPRYHDPRDRDRDPRTGRLGGPGGPAMQAPGPHAGRGPRNYRRADARIHEELCERLTADPDVDASDIEVEVTEARVLLRGTVPDRRMKHRAEDLADGLFGVAEVGNQLRVQRPGGPRGTARGSSDDPSPDRAQPPAAAGEDSP
jgi:hypothetical protein